MYIFVYPGVFSQLLKVHEVKTSPLKQERAPQPLPPQFAKASVSRDTHGVSTFFKPGGEKLTHHALTNRRLAVIINDQ